MPKAAKYARKKSQFLFIQMNDFDQPIQRKINESLAHSQANAENALNTGVEVLMRLRSQNEKLTHASDTISPLLSMAEASNKVIGNISGALSSGKLLFLFLAILTIVILFLVIRWKHA